MSDLSDFMKVIGLEVPNNPTYARLFEWTKLISIVGSAQIIVQAIGFVSSILIIRLLPSHEYAMYTLANTMLGTMIMLADGGIATGVMSQGGGVWQDRDKLGTVLATGLDLRKKFAVGSLVIAIPVLIYLLKHHDVSWSMSVLIVLSLMPTFFAALSGSVLEIAPKLRQDITSMQKINVTSNLGRLLLLGATLFILPWGFIAILAAGIPQIWANTRLRKISNIHANNNQIPDPIVRKKILGVVKRMFPDIIYFCLSGQITIWLISIFGTTAAVAQVGALGRFAIMLSLCSVMFSGLVLPRFARLVNHSTLLLKRYLQIQLCLITVSASIIGVFWLFSSEILWILGEQYAGLTKELLLLMIGSCISFVAGSSFFLCTSRGWVINPLLSISINLATVACGIIVFDISNLQGIFILNIFIAVIQVIMHVVYGFVNILKAKELPV